MDQEIKDLKRRAGITEEYDRRAALKALEVIDNAMVDLLDELYGLDDQQRDALIRGVEEAGEKLSIVRRTLRRIEPTGAGGNLPFMLRKQAS